MVKYENGKIYKLVNDVDDQIYIGSTCNPLHVRKGQHKNTALRGCRSFVYQHLNNIGWNNVRIILIENFSCTSKNELCAREQYFIDELKPSLNKQRAIDDCPHGKTHYVCKECNGSGICKHNKLRTRCKECDGNGICEHKKRKERCKECKGGSICKHNKRRYECKECDGNGICEHGERKERCKDCTNYYCDVCDQKFAGKYALTRHQKSKKHQKNLEKINASNNIECLEAHHENSETDPPNAV